MPPIRHALDLNFFTAASTSTGCCYYLDTPVFITIREPLGSWGHARSKTHSEASSGRLRLERTKLNLVKELSEFTNKFGGPPLECLRIEPSAVFDVAHALV
jgi:hypothetical protein